MVSKMGRPRKHPAEMISKVISFAVKPDTFMTIESSTADQRSEFWRGVAENIAAAIERGDPVANIPLASLDNYQALQSATGGTDEPPTP